MEKTYLKFGEALDIIKVGGMVERKGWNGKDMYVTLIPARRAVYQGSNIQDCLALKTPEGNMQPGWLPSQEDLLTEDWRIV